MLTAVLTLPVVVQGIALTFDEAHYHRKRGLPLWERLGHPLDSATLLACLLWARLVPWSSGALAAYAGLAAFSCLFVTKDELVHARACGPGEHWLHALLFLLHPVVLAAAALLWREAAHGAGLAALVLSCEAAAVAVFMVYQLVYWNVLRGTEDQQRIL